MRKSPRGIPRLVQRRFNKQVIVESWKTQFSGVQNQSLAAGHLEGFLKGSCAALRILGRSLGLRVI
jgi:hypothetical protein